MTDGPVLLAHVALALTRYVETARRQRIEVPAELVTAAAWLVAAARTSGADMARQGPTVLVTGWPGDDSAPMPELLSLADTAHALGVSIRTVERRAEEGALKTVKLGGVVRVRRSDLDAFVAGLPARRSEKDPAPPAP